MNIIDGIVICIGLALFFLMGYMTIISWQEKEHRATKIALILTIIVPLPYWIVGWSHQPVIAIFLISITLAGVGIMLLPIRQKPIFEKETPTTRIDERDIMFSRAELKPGTDRYKEYYHRRPENKSPDDKFRAEAGLLSKSSTFYHPLLFSSAKASFRTVERFKAIVDGEVAPTKEQLDPAQISQYIKNWSHHLGVLDVGITNLKPYHLYTHVGRGNHYGEKVDLNHQYAIAFTVEMDKLMMDCAPAGSTVMESAQQYLVSGMIATQVAIFIRQLGYTARAHIDGNYRLICPLVARDAGLGEIGRMGLLMTPSHGPRVRISVVTTDLPLIPNIRHPDPTVIDFCTHCKKCAETCPAQAIPFIDRLDIDGVKRWQIDSEACYTLWCIAGTDCGRCMSVCPYSHPYNSLHNMVRWNIRNSWLFRRLAIPMDDFLYGRKPISASLPEWMNFRNE